MSKSVKISLAMVAVVAIALLGLFAVNRGDNAPAPSADASASIDTTNLVRPDSPRLSEGKKADFVEFLDFECESCLQLFPAVEELRQKYGKDVGFVVRYFPITSEHPNAMNAALAAESAKKQGKFEQMYVKLFKTADEWGHKPASQKDTFFGYAKELGLNMDTFAKDFDDPATKARIEQSAADGKAAGVEGTPSFFLDGKRFAPQSDAELTAAFDEAIK